MYAFRAFVRHNVVLCAAAALAALSMLFVPPDREYLGYINGRVLTVLFVLMAAVAGFSGAGLFVRLSGALTRRTTSARTLGLGLVLLCFFLSMLITNDVALITFVPFTLGLFGRERRVVPVLVMETVGANLGSLLTPIGNPQNLYLYSYYALTAGDFFRAVLPLGLLCLALVTGLTLLLVRGGAVPAARANDTLSATPFALLRYSLLFALGLLTVMRTLDWRICLGVSALLLLVFDRPLFRCVDWSLLASFVCFFVLVGNLARIEAVRGLIESLLLGREYRTAALLSQVISNVPAATMLSGFTTDWRALLLGVNVGGLGTPIASMASLITLRFYSSAPAPGGRYLAVFSAVNFALLALLLALEPLLL